MSYSFLANCVKIFLSEQSVHFSVILLIVVLGVLIAAIGIGKSCIFTSLFTVVCARNIVFVNK